LSGSDAIAFFLKVYGTWRMSGTLPKLTCAVLECQEYTCIIPTFYLLKFPWFLGGLEAVSMRKSGRGKLFFRSIIRNWQDKYILYLVWKLWATQFWAACGTLLKQLALRKKLTKQHAKS